MTRNLNKFLIMWCTDGLESVINLTELEMENMVHVLMNENIKVPHSNPIHFMILRAIYNMQRHYEIYLIESDITREEFIDLFESDAQCIVDLIREKGEKIYSDRLPTKTLIK